MIKDIKILLSFFALCLMVTACTDEDIINKAETDLFTVGGNIVSVSGVTADGEYDLCCISDAVVAYDVTTAGSGASSVERTISHSSGASGTLPAVTSFPSNSAVSLTDAMAACGLTEADLEVGQTFTIRHTVDGNPSGATVSIGVVNSVVIFRSALQGVFNAKATVTNQAAGIGWDGCEGNEWEGQVEFVAEHTMPDETGTYQVFTFGPNGEMWDDVSMGAYYACYNTDDGGNLPNGASGDLRLTDVDGKLAIPGASQWGEVFTVTMASGGGATATIGWTNDYGEGAIIELTRTDGMDWPDLSN